MTAVYWGLGAFGFGAVGIGRVREAERLPYGIAWRQFYMDLAGGAVLEEIDLDELEKIKNWLISYPGWGSEALAVDTVGARAGCGLFPLGMEVLQTRVDVLGNCQSVCQLRFLLRRVALRQEPAARWLLEFQNWVRQQSRAGLAPQFGDVPREEVFRAEKGKLVKAVPAGQALYEVELTATFIKEE